MKKIIITFMTLAAVTSLTACGGTDSSLKDDSSSSVMETETVATTEVTTEAQEETTVGSTETGDTAESSDDSSDSDSAAASSDEMSAYVGEWSCDGGAGYIILKIDSDGTFTSVSPYGEVFTANARAYSDKIDVGENIYSYEDGCLVDMAGYKYSKFDTVPAGCESVASYVGVWKMDGGAGENTLTLFANGSYELETAGGDKQNGTITADEKGIVFSDENNNSLSYEDGALVDMAGYKYEKISSSPY